ncbi:hypothetical protein [Sphingosinicella sp.]|uniref:hypothetical protein n=1 Tax=Sphingosinicella sp. TaxID=1917971 RepID=UPI0017E44786|nr:hypothetical protein [Sphingosinicella sp.]MBA4757741.1 hypothetical protein [Sphingosinicella sp.]
MTTAAPKPIATDELRDMARELIRGCGGDRALALVALDEIRGHVWRGKFCGNPLCGDPGCTGCLPY